MKLETILNAAISSMVRGHHSPHCYRAHVAGRGYVNDGSTVFDRADYLRQLESAARSEVDNMGFAPGYAEPGYEDPKHCVLFANWNCLPRELGDILERAGYAVEWSDEWSTCDECGKAVRTSPDSYSWERAYTMPDEYTILCRECTDWQEHCRSCEDQSDRAVTSDVDPAEYGYERLSRAAEFENGFHPGQTDDPKAILAKLHSEGKHGILFRVSSVGQFDVSFETWIRKAKDGEDSAEDSASSSAEV